MGRTGRDQQMPFYDGKSCRHTIKYEIGVHPDTGKIVWVGGPTIGSMHNITLTRNSGILDLLEINELVLTDKGYIGPGLEQVLTPIKKPRGRELNEDEKEINMILGARRWIVEHVIAKIKFFHCLQMKWRHLLDIHHIVFFVIANIVNIDLRTRPMRK
jgi:hypothetical protein